MALANFRMLVYELLNEDPDMAPKEDPLIVLVMHMADLLSKTIKGASFGTMLGS